MIKYISIIIIMCFVLSTGSSAYNKKKKVYWIDKGVTVLAFIGNPHSLKLHPVRFTTYKKQVIKLFHKKSGPGIYAFYLPGFAAKDIFGGERIIPYDGYFMVKKRFIRSPEDKKKISMKHKTFNHLKKGDSIK